MGKDVLELSLRIGYVVSVHYLRRMNAKRLPELAQLQNGFLKPKANRSLEGKIAVKIIPENGLVVLIEFV